MASSASLEASEIRRRGRRRLIGAVAIVLVLVVFVPMLLDSEPRPAGNGPALEIPPKDNAPPLPSPAPASSSTAVTPTGTPLATPGMGAKAAAPATPSSATAAANPASGASSSPATTSSTAPAPAVPASTTTSSSAGHGAPPAAPAVAQITPVAKNESAPAHAATDKPAPKLEGYAVQVGAFRDAQKLRQAREKLAKAGVPHYTERLEGSSKGLTRLRAGPFKTRAAAEAAMKKASIKGKVVSLHEDH